MWLAPLNIKQPRGAGYGWYEWWAPIFSHFALALVILIRKSDARKWGEN